jgi:hypothetical protein
LEDLPAKEFKDRSPKPNATSPEDVFCPAVKIVAATGKLAVTVLWITYKATSCTVKIKKGGPARDRTAEIQKNNKRTKSKSFLYRIPSSQGLNTWDVYHLTSVGICLGTMSLFSEIFVERNRRQARC